MALSWLMTYNSQQLKEKRCINERCAVRSFFQLMNVCNESIHEIDTEEGSQKLCSHKVPRPKRRRWMAVWMVMSKPRTHIVVCWDTVSMLHFLYISFTFPLLFLYFSFTLLSRDLQRNTDARLTQRLIRRIQRCRRTRNLARHGERWFQPHIPHICSFCLCCVFCLQGQTY